MSVSAVTGAGTQAEQCPRVSRARLQDRLCRRFWPYARRSARLGLSLLAGHACRSTLVRPRAFERQEGRCRYRRNGGRLRLRRVGLPDFCRQPARLAARHLAGDIPGVSPARPRASGGCGRYVPHHHGRRSAARDRIRVGSSGLHLFRARRKRARGPSDVCGSSPFPHAVAGGARVRARRSKNEPPSPSRSPMRPC